MDAGGQKKEVVPFGSGVGPLGTELALRHEVQQRKQLTARMDDKLRKQRIGRLRAEKKVLLGFVVCHNNNSPRGQRLPPPHYSPFSTPQLALEMRETRALEAELERLQVTSTLHTTRQATHNKQPVCVPTP